MKYSIEYIYDEIPTSVIRTEYDPAKSSAAPLVAIGTYLPMLAAPGIHQSTKMKHFYRANPLPVGATAEKLQIFLHYLDIFINPNASH
jgi:hypothetical protein